MTKKTISVVIYGQTFSKSNSRIFTHISGKPRLIKKKEVQDFVNTSLLQLKSQLRNHTTFEGKVIFEANIYYRSNRSDLDESLLMDIIEQKKDKKTGIILLNGIYKNDRQIVEKHIYKHIDKNNPRAEITVTEI